jgi:hypothetical protein
MPSSSRLHRVLASGQRARKPRCPVTLVESSLLLPSYSTIQHPEIECMCLVEYPTCCQQSNIRASCHKTFNPDCDTTLQDMPLPNSPAQTPVSSDSACSHGGGRDLTISAPHMHSIALELLSKQLRPGARVLDVGSVRAIPLHDSWLVLYSGTPHLLIRIADHCLACLNTSWLLRKVQVGFYDSV